MHRSEPQPTRRIGFAIIDPVLRPIRLYQVRDCDFKRICPHRCQTVAETRREPAFRAANEETDRFGNLDRLMLPGWQVQAVDRRCINVDPPECLRFRDPDRTFAQSRAYHASR